MLESAPVSHRFLRACRREPVDVTPIWIMRQAGRYLPEYRAVREKVSFLELARSPDLAAEVTVQPITRLDVDAAILFSDILLVLPPMGLEVSFADEGGPRVQPVRGRDEVARLRSFDPSVELKYVGEAIRRTRRALDGRVPLIGFCGAPWTLLTYAVEGGSTRTFAASKRLLYGDPDTCRLLLSKLGAAVRSHLLYQIESGAEAVQIFDSWAGELSASDYEAMVLPVMQGIVADLKATGVPVIVYANGGAALLERLARTGADVVGVDHRVPLDDAWARLGEGVAVMGNLDPTALFADVPAIERMADDILRRAAGRPGHIFNLGHGILPETPPDHAKALVDRVHRHTPLKASPNDVGGMASGALGAS
jgi:uroporphyrinogen decarboxylase